MRHVSQRILVAPDVWAMEGLDAMPGEIAVLVGRGTCCQGLNAPFYGYTSSDDRVLVAATAREPIEFMAHDTARNRGIWNAEQ